MSNSNRDNLLQDLGSLASIVNYFQLSSINDKFQEANEKLIIASQKEEKQKKLREKIFGINHFITSEITDFSDKLVYTFAILIFKNSISKASIDSSSFTQISDKQYFSETVKLLDVCWAENESFQPEAIMIEKDYRYLVAFSNILNNVPQVKKCNDKLKNRFFPYLLIYFLSYLFLCLLPFEKNNFYANLVNGYQDTGFIYITLFIGSIISAFPFTYRMNSKSHYRYKLNTLKKNILFFFSFIDINDIKLMNSKLSESDELLNYLNTLKINLAKKIVTHEKLHSELCKARKLFDMYVFT